MERHFLRIENILRIQCIQILETFIIPEILRARLALPPDWIPPVVVVLRAGHEVRFGAGVAHGAVEAAGSGEAGIPIALGRIPFRASER